MTEVMIIVNTEYLYQVKVCAKNFTAIILFHPHSKLLFCFFFWPCYMACNILVPQPGIELVPPAVELQNTNHWTAREVPNLHSKLLREICYYSHFTGIETEA